MGWEMSWEQAAKRSSILSGLVWMVVSKEISI
jgi:hypothetical protein